MSAWCIEGEIFAEPMIDKDEYLNLYVEQLEELIRQRMLPDLDTKFDYKVYSIRGSDVGAHKSIVLSTDDEHFVTVELGFTEIDGKKHIYPVTIPLPSIMKPKLKFHGTINTTGAVLILKAVETMKDFGMYFKFCNNCQNYCNEFLKSIGLGESTELTDVEKAVVVTGAAVAAVGGLALLIKFLSVKQTK